MAAAVQHTVKLGTHTRAHEGAGDQGPTFTKGPLVFETSGARARPHVVSEKDLIVLATNVLNVTRQDVSSIYSSVDMDLPEGLRASLTLPCGPSDRFSSFMALE